MNGSTEDIRAPPRLRALPAASPPTAAAVKLSYEPCSELHLLSADFCQYCHRGVNIYAEASLERGFFLLSNPDLVLRTCFLRFQRTAPVTACGPAAPRHLSRLPDIPAPLKRCRLRRLSSPNTHRRAGFTLVCSCSQSRHSCRGAGTFPRRCRGTSDARGPSLWLPL